MATFIFTTDLDNFQGTNDADIFRAFNNRLNAGDIVDGSAGVDTVTLATDASITSTNFSGFTLNSVEIFSVTSDATPGGNIFAPTGGAINIDLSGATGLTTLVNTNSSQGVTFTQVTSLLGTGVDEGLRLVNLTDPATSFTRLQFRDAVVAGSNDSVRVTLDSSTANNVRIGSVSSNNSGIENVTLVTLGGPSSINQLNTNLTVLNIQASASLVIGSTSLTAPANPGTLTSLNSTVRLINVDAGSGDVALSFAGASAGVGYVRAPGGTGADIIQATSNADFISTGSGNDRIFAGGGADTIRAGDGDNYVVTQSTTQADVTTGVGNDRIVGGVGTDVIRSGGGADIVDLRNGGRDAVATGDGNDLIVGGSNFNAATVGGVVQDFLDGGDGVDELRVDAGLGDPAFLNVQSIEVLSITSTGTTTLGTNAQAAGIRQVNLDVSGAFNADTARAGDAAVVAFRNDVLDASAYTTGLVVGSRGGDDTITTGSGNDSVFMIGDGSLDSADVLVGGAGFDALNLIGGATIFAGTQISGFEIINLGSSPDKSSPFLYNFTLDNGNAPTAVTGGGVARLGINGSTLTADEEVQINAMAVTTFALDISTGAGNDTIVSGTLNDSISSGAGNDEITLVGGNNIVDAGADNDDVVIQSGNNTVFLGDGTDIVRLGTGNDTVFGGAGGDLFISDGNLTAADKLDGGDNTDTLTLTGTTADAAFTQVTNFELLEVNGGMTTLGAFASNAGFTNVTDKSAGASNINATGFTGGGLVFNLEAGGNDVVQGTAQDDRVITGTGDNQLILGGGNDTVVVSGNELTFSDVISGGPDTGSVVDTIVLDNSMGNVTANVNLFNVTSIERYEFSSNGIETPVVANQHLLSFSGGTIGTVTPIAVDFSRLSDPNDSAFVVVNAADADYTFNVTGASAGITTVAKTNFGINNNINFTGGAGDDRLAISGQDLGSTVTFTGGAGIDGIFQINGGTAAPGGAQLITDDGFIGISGVEFLASNGGVGSQRVFATLGMAAADSGLTTIVGGTGNDNVTFDAAFDTANLVIDLRTSDGGSDIINGSAATTAFAFFANSATLTAADVLSGGTGAGDTLTLRSSGASADATSVTGVETINFDFLPGTVAAGNNGTTLLVDTTNPEVNGGFLTVNASNFDSDDVLTLNGGTAGANLSVTGGAAADIINTGSGDDVVRGGAGNDTINLGGGTNTAFGEAGDDRINGGAGVDLVDGGAGADKISGGAGNDVLAGGFGNDAIRGQAGQDRIFGDDGDDGIFGGGAADVLTGGAGADTFFYQSGTDSSTSIPASSGGGRDTITDFVSGTDKIDIRSISTTGTGGAVLNGSTINFVGNAGDFGTAQGALIPGNGQIEAVYQQDANVLWFDLDDNGILNGSDLQIILQGVTTLTGADVFSGSMIDNTTAGGTGTLLFLQTNFSDQNIA